MKRHLFRPPLEVHTVTATAYMGVRSSVQVKVNRLKPDDDATSMEWSRYLDQRVDDLRVEHDRKVKRLEDRLKQMELRTQDGVQQLRMQMDEKHDRLLTAIAGREGNGLDLAWWGLVAVGVGTAMQFIAVIRFG